MARKDEAEKLLRQGLFPSAIAERMGISVKTVVQYLRLKVGEGALRLSDLYYSYPANKREVLQQAGTGRHPNLKLLSANSLCRDDLELFQSLRTSRTFHGDLYEYISTAEVAIHKFVEVQLKHALGPDDDGWWREGISADIRAKCASRREEDDDPCESAYAYTTLIDLSKIISKNWKHFKSELPDDYGANRHKLESDFARLNKIRNAVMHPVKDKKWSEDDFVFVRRICKLFRKVAGA